MAKTYIVTAYPYAMQQGTLRIPDNVDDIRKYIRNNWDDIEFGEPDLDYSGTDFDADEIIW